MLHLSLFFQENLKLNLAGQKNYTKAKLVILCILVSALPAGLCLFSYAQCNSYSQSNIGSIERTNLIYIQRFPPLHSSLKTPNVCCSFQSRVPCVLRSLPLVIVSFFPSVTAACHTHLLQWRMQRSVLFALCSMITATFFSVI